MSAEVGIEIAVGVLRALFEAAPAAYEALRGEKVEDILARGRERLPAAGAARAAVDEIFAKSPTLPPPPERFRLAPTTVPLVARLLDGHVARETLTPEEVRELRVMLEITRALERGELVPAIPAVLDPPVGAWTEPSNEKD